jgi:hypothetical protein
MLKNTNDKSSFEKYGKTSSSTREKTSGHCGKKRKKKKKKKN